MNDSEGTEIDVPLRIGSVAVVDVATVSAFFEMPTRFFSAVRLASLSCASENHVINHHRLKSMICTCIDSLIMPAFVTSN